MSKLKDTHYRNKPIQPIELQEQLMDFNEEVPPKQRHLIAMASKHIVRAGEKTDNPWEQDIHKAMNYLFRSVTGMWLDEADLNKYFHDK